MDLPDLSPAVVIEAPLDEGWPGGMGCHDTPLRAWRLPSTLSWELVAYRRSCEFAGPLPDPVFQLFHEGASWWLPGELSVSPGHLHVTLSFQQGQIVIHDTFDLDLDAETVTGERHLQRLDDERVHREQWTITEPWQRWPLDLPRRWRS